MERNSMGSFIAALRRSRGLTQSEVAESLSVSNKAVSKWERDENFPDVTLIPAIAELFGVTSDDLLRGGPAPASDAASAGGEVRTERLARRLIKKKLNSVALYSWLAIGLVFLGFIFAFLLWGLIDSSYSGSFFAHIPYIAVIGLFLILAGAGVIIQILVLITQRIAPDELDFDVAEGAVKTISRRAKAYALATFILTAVTFTLLLMLILYV